MVAPCTTTIRGLASEVVLEPGDDPLGRVSVVSLDSLESVSLGSLVQRIGRLSEIRMEQICDGLGMKTNLLQPLAKRLLAEKRLKAKGKARGTTYTVA